ncbi:MAG: acetyl-CoA carboxylase biotin carboxyl carrier protein subunit [Muribaculaceae bacterium]|nr:acetyl-CoA carboxylase biotin carboxyl carrier protein subunit [Muribaculaceae bacterium]
MKEYKISINGHEYTVCINSVNGNQASVNVNGTDYQVTIPAAGAPAPAAPVNPVSPVAAAPAPAAPAAAPAAAGAGTVLAPLPGVVLSIPVKVGDSVGASDPVVILEAMKMENAIPAGRAGKVIAINVKEGDSVLEGAVLVTLG